jgi:hypothetical protein
LIPLKEKLFVILGVPFLSTVPKQLGRCLGINEMKVVKDLCNEKNKSLMKKLKRIQINGNISIVHKLKENC